MKWFNSVAIFLAFTQVSVAVESMPSGVDPMTAIVQTEDAERFAALFRSESKNMTPDQIQRA